MLLISLHFKFEDLLAANGFAALLKVNLDVFLGAVIVLPPTEASLAREGDPHSDLKEDQVSQYIFHCYSLYLHKTRTVATL